MIVTANYQRKTFRVQAIRVTTENLGELSQWCEGIVRLQELGMDGFRPYIAVPTGGVQDRTQRTRAYIGDWVTRLSEGNNFRVYKNKTFIQAFEEIRMRMERYPEVLDLVNEAMKSDRTVVDPFTLSPFGDDTDRAEEIAKKIISLF